MKCYNIFCQKHDPFNKLSEQNCVRDDLKDHVKNCDSRKLYNLWNKIITGDKHTWFFVQWKEMKDKYHGRIK